MIDVPTLFAILCLDSLVIAATVFAIRAGRLQDGQASWIAALLCQSVAMALFTWMALRPPVPWAIVASIVALSAAFSLFAASMAQFVKRPIPRIALVLPPILLGVQHVLWMDDFISRALASNLILAAQLLLCAWPLWRPTNEGDQRYRLLVIASFLLGSASTLLRFGELLLAPERLPDLAVSEPINAFAFLLNHANLILGNLGIAMLHRERNRIAAELLSTRDRLTELFNQRSFVQQAAREILRAERGGQSVSVLMIDPDHFHEINTRFGSLAGDRVLQHVAQVLTATLRGQDLCARYGAEEFAVLLADTSQDGAITLAERIRARCNEAPVGPDRVQFTVSIGIAELNAGERDASALIDRAEAALARAKQNGRNRVEQEGGRDEL
ncbi:GGDEF domain-containing protein [Niveibacterium sp. 24ML]|uniref:GGDEF domain-containing protein n=1 Tax=Niveibacterium sp. 24ML TaxID=2985512 RepID=UPI00226FA5DB|nr:GGDEF domain-containing protein [Niveibacterium sp. 24ML]MCX9156994.1 GGDEF domain-containing protein [Niveibacterium sp. 24ML]